MRKPGQLITKTEQKEHGLSRQEAREIERREWWSGEVLLGQAGGEALVSGWTEQKEEKAATREARKEAKSAKKEAKLAKKLGYAGRDMEAVLSEGERQKILSEEIKKLTKWSSPWSCRERGTTWAVLVDPAGDPIGTGGAIMAVGTLGLSLATAPIRRGRDNDKYLNIEILPNGTVERTGSLLYGGTDYSNVKKLEN